MTTSTHKVSLSDRSFFDYMPAESMAEIAKRVKTKTFPAGTIIFEEGEFGEQGKPKIARRRTRKGGYDPSQMNLFGE